MPRSGSAWTCWSRCTTRPNSTACSVSSRKLIGVNNRNLKDFSVSFDRTYELADCTFVAESGLSTRADFDAMTDHGVHCFLIGESLMRQDDV